MGEYFKPIILKKDWKKRKDIVEFSTDSWSSNNGAKLMEHSWAGNNFVGLACFMLRHLYYGYPFVWASDYVEAEEVTTEAYPQGVYIYGHGSNYADSEGCKYFLNYFNKEYEVIPQYNYAVNLDKNEYVRIPKYNKKEHRVHPLPLLCCNSDGRGGGWYHGKTGLEYIGRWAYDRIGVANSRKAIEGMTEIKPDFKEEW
jgi:hypothetical protein